MLILVKGDDVRGSLHCTCETEPTSWNLLWPLHYLCYHSKKAAIKHLMTGTKGNSEFCFPETLNVPRGEAEGNVEVEGKQNSLFPEGQVIKCFVIPPNSKMEKKLRNNDLNEW